MFNFYGRENRHSARKYQDDMKNLWQENSEATVQFINNALVGSAHTNHWSQLLANNQQRIANGIIKFYSDKEKISTLFNQFIQYIGQAIDVFMWKKNEVRFRERWYQKADELANMLHGFNKWNVHEYFYKQITLIESLIKSFIKKNVEAIEHYRKELISNNFKLSITISNGIISDNMKSFY